MSLTVVIKQPIGSDKPFTGYEYRIVTINPAISAAIAMNIPDTNINPIMASIKLLMSLPF